MITTLNVCDDSDRDFVVPIIHIEISSKIISLLNRLGDCHCNKSWAGD